MLGIAIIVSALLLISIKYVDDISDRFNRWWKYARFFVGVAMVFTVLGTVWIFFIVSTLVTVKFPNQCAYYGN
jgi:hypothetical protein